MNKIINLNFLILALLLSIHAKATIRYVSSSGSNTAPYTSWATAGNDLQTVINACSSGDQVWVKAGTYKPNSYPPYSGSPSLTNRDYTFFIPDGISLFGGFAGTETILSERNININMTILSGDIGTPVTLTDNCYHVVMASSSTAGNGIFIDGFTISGGYANAGGSITVNSNAITKNQGGGIYIFNESGFLVANNKITGNYASASSFNSGGGLYATTATSIVCTGTVFNNEIFANSCASAGAGAGLLFFASNSSSYKINANFIHDNTGTGAYGGGLYLRSGGNYSITNNVFYNNTATYGGAINSSTNTAYTDTIANNTFYNNSVAGSGWGAAISIGTGNHLIFNNVFNGNKRGSATTAAEVYNNTTTSNKVNNNILQNAKTTYSLTISGSTDNNKYSTNPLFTNTTSAIGADSLINTADDGLHVQCTSPAIGNGGITGTNGVYGIPKKDCESYTRSTSSPTIGAYEQVGAELLTLASTYTSLTKNQSGTVIYGDCSTNLICTVTSSGANPVSGNTTSKVWIDATQNPNFVVRHYEIFPASNASTATGTITLYFTQSEFDAFNAVNSIKLPQNSTDASGKANLLIEKRSGTSSDGSGHYSTYPGAAININPNDADIVWSSTANRWQVTFNTDGFSGFWVKTTSDPLPIKWLNLSASLNTNQKANLNWLVLEENVKNYEIEKSLGDGIFEKIGTVKSKGNGEHVYNYSDITYLKKAYYRVKMIDFSGNYTYSKIILIANNDTDDIFTFPNPAIDIIHIINGKVGEELKLTDVNGRLIKSQTIESSAIELNISEIPAGIYFLFTNSGAIHKIVKY